MDTHSRKKDLLRKYLNDDCSRDELEELLGYLKSGKDDPYKEVTADLWKHIREEKKIEDKKAKLLVENAVNAGKQTKNKRHRAIRWYRTAAAAVFALLIGASMIYVFSDKREQPAVTVKPVTKFNKKDIKPGGRKAILKAGNSAVALNKRDTTFRMAGNVVNIHGGDVQVAHEKPVLYTLITPKGGEYNLVLEDGTKVWLNADSRLVYPSVFQGDTRKVQLTGEAYFEVKTDADHPFIVHTDKQDIRVLGTRFNVQAYPDESRNVTTLIQGKVQVNGHGEKIQLQQGQQAISDEGGKLSLNPYADVRQAIAWKEGYFRFDFTDIYEIMRRLSRWYDVKVSYEKGVRHREFLAFINRNNNISQILGMLEATGEIRFKIDSGKVTVMPPESGAESR